MILLDLTLLFFLFLVVLNYRAQRSVLFPPFIFCAMWLLDLAVFRSGLIEVDPDRVARLDLIRFSRIISGSRSGFVQRWRLDCRSCSAKVAPHSSFSAQAGKDF